jgi:hypothetical protein
MIIKNILEAIKIQPKIDFLPRVLDFVDNSESISGSEYAVSFHKFGGITVAVLDKIVDGTKTFENSRDFAKFLHLMTDFASKKVVPRYNPYKIYGDCKILAKNFISFAKGNKEILNNSFTSFPRFGMCEVVKKFRFLKPVDRLKAMPNFDKHFINIVSFDNVGKPIFLAVDFTAYHNVTRDGEYHAVCLVADSLKELEQNLELLYGDGPWVSRMY